MRQRGGAPSLRLQGNASQVARRLAVSHMALSLSHSRDYAVASVVMETAQQAPVQTWAEAGAP